MKPLADFVCTSKACASEDGEGQTVYPDLPIDAKVCPYGHKRLVRLYNKAPGLLRSGSRDMQKIIDQAGGEALGRQSTLRDARLNHDKMEREIAAANGGRPVSPSLAVPINAIAAKLGALGVPGGSMGLRTGEAHVTPTVSSPLLAGTVARRHMKPNVQKAWAPTPEEFKKAGG